MTVCGVKRGSCTDVTCDLHGWCHCGCGRRTRVADTSHSRRGFVRGSPLVHAHGHSPLAQANLSPGHAPEIPLDRIQVFLDWGRARYGSWRKMGTVMGRGEEYINNMRRHGGVRPATAKFLMEFVLAHRQGTSAFFDEVTERRLPSEAERTSTRREHERRERAGFRERHREAS